jgi:hypothetical protein
MIERVDDGMAPPVAGWASGPLGEVQAADREIARQTARRARAVALFAADRPASVDRVQGEPGAMSAQRWAARPEVLRPVSEWAAQELVIALSISQQAAENLLERSLLLVHRLPGTLVALETGVLHVGHLWPMLDKVAPIEDDAVRAQVEAVALEFAGRRVTTPAQLGAKLRRELLARGAREAGRRLARGLRERGVFLRPEHTDGLAGVTAVLTVPEARALHEALAQLADSLHDEPDAPGGPRTRGQKMADALLDLVLRPGETDLPPVQVLLTLVASVQTALGGEGPGELDGHVIPAEMVRDLLQGLLGRRGTPGPPDDAAAGVDEPLHREGCAACPEDEPDDLAAWWAEVERRVLADELPDQPEVVPDEVLAAWAEERLADRGGPPAAAGAADPGPPVVPPAGAAADAPFARVSPRPGPGPEPEPPPGRWWAAADRAVDTLADAALQADLALAHACRLVRTAVAADAADEQAWQATDDARAGAAADALGALAAASAARREELGALLSATAGGGLAERPRIALVDALSGTFLALTDLPGLRREGTCGAPACRRRPEECMHDLSDRPGFRPPGPAVGYRPSRLLDRWVRARDRRCRFPGCRRRVPRAGELDHVVRHPDGPTSTGNLCGFCTGHHRGKHQAPGWSYELDLDGTLTVTTPTGLVNSTVPPPY